MPKIVVLWSDVVVIATLLLLVLYGFRIRASSNLRATWMKVLTWSWHSPIEPRRSSD